jgi:quercetin dioxygenase-like cupin family protein
MAPPPNQPYGQDPIQADPKHYQLEFENEQVRILRLHFGPHEKSVMHSHPPGVVVILTDCNFRFDLSRGKTQDMIGKAGQIILFEEPFEHASENLSNKPFEAVFVELKNAQRREPQNNPGS